MAFRLSRSEAKIKFASQQEFAVGADLEFNVAVEGFFCGVSVKDLRAATDNHRRSKGSREARFDSTSLYLFVLSDDLQLNTIQPSPGVQIRTWRQTGSNANRMGS